MLDVIVTLTRTSISPGTIGGAAAASAIMDCRAIIGRGSGVIDRCSSIRMTRSTFSSRASRGRVGARAGIGHRLPQRFTFRTTHDPSDRIGRR